VRAAFVLLIEDCNSKLCGGGAIVPAAVVALSAADWLRNCRADAKEHTQTVEATRWPMEVLPSLLTNKYTNHNDIGKDSSHLSSSRDLYMRTMMPKVNYTNPLHQDTCKKQKQTPVANRVTETLQNTDFWIVSAFSLTPSHRKGEARGEGKTGTYWLV
jgi:hypothetical protein